MGFLVTLQVRPCKLGLGMTIKEDLMPRAQGCAGAANASHGQENPFAMLISGIQTNLNFHVLTLAKLDNIQQDKSI